MKLHHIVYVQHSERRHNQVGLHVRVLSKGQLSLAVSVSLAEVIESALIW